MDIALRIASGIPATFARIGWYADNLRQDFEGARESGVVADSVGDGRLATAPHSDMAEAIAVILTTPGLEGKVYELSGDTVWNYPEFAQTAADVLGTPVSYQTLTPEQERERLTGFGPDEQTVGFLGVLNAGMRESTQASSSGDLARLLDRPTTPLADTVRSWK